jgi:hypothetical protein
MAIHIQTVLWAVAWGGNGEQDGFFGELEKLRALERLALTK